MWTESCSVVNQSHRVSMWKLQVVGKKEGETQDKRKVKSIKWLCEYRNSQDKQDEKEEEKKIGKETQKTCYKTSIKLDKQCQTICCIFKMKMLKISVWYVSWGLWDNPLKEGLE